MSPEERLEELRQLFLHAPETESTRLIAVGLSLGLITAVLLLVRRRTLRAEYTPVWVLVALFTFALSAFPPLLTFVTRSLGAWTGSSAIFFLGHLFLVAICLNYAVRLSGLTLQVKNLTQEVTVLRAQVEGAQPRAVGAGAPSVGEP
ncbi:MAG: hypothetical protein CL910_22410 [Deltaproteobacteria bacterium]|jgi:hypothetical protein|nr:hypothetical protein [Deltaproteobacteria bacterium]